MTLTAILLAVAGTLLALVVGLVAGFFVGKRQEPRKKRPLPEPSRPSPDHLDKADEDAEEKTPVSDYPGDDAHVHDFIERARESEELG